MRHSEKLRHSSGIFADVCASLCIRTYWDNIKSSCTLEKQGYKLMPNVLCGIVVCYHDNINIDQLSSDSSVLNCVALGLGTKYSNLIQLATIVQSIQNAPFSINDVSSFNTNNDCHAEPLAKKAFILYIISEMHSLMAGNSSRILQFTNCIDMSNDIHSFNSSAPLFPANASNYIFELKKNVSFHMYCSSQPCGNACWRRWGLGKNPQKSLLNPNESQLNLKFQNKISSFLQPYKHPMMHIVEIQKGQVSVLYKYNSGVIKPKCYTKINTKAIRLNTDTDTSNYLINGHVWKHMPSGVQPPFLIDLNRKNDIDDNTGTNDLTSLSNQLPSGYSIKPIVSCSDKIAKWNILGIQGSLLSPLIKPIYIRSIVIGRKQCITHSERAFCCRLQNIDKLIRKKGRSQQNDYDPTFISDMYRLNHIEVLSTAIPLDQHVQTETYKCNFDNCLSAIWYKSSDQIQHYNQHVKTIHFYHNGKEIDNNADNAPTPGSLLDQWLRLKCIYQMYYSSILQLVKPYGTEVITVKI